MQKFPYVLSECEQINTQLHKPINFTQRIKYTCFNVSQNYIVLGSTSGSIYVFARESCCFQQLIPLSEGAATLIRISPDEKTVALVTIRGTVCLIALKSTTKPITTMTEHNTHLIICLCWNDNSSEIYLGDTGGKVSVLVLSIFTVTGIFQSPACTLMNLGTSILQLSFSSPLLLVTTLTRCYICDTVLEHYKQIGNKTRYGEFWACFYKTENVGKNIDCLVPKDEKSTAKKGLFNLLSENDDTGIGENDLTIFCARPGSRLWEVSANGIVRKTHQFKDALNVPPVAIHRYNKISTENRDMEESTALPRTINFSWIFSIGNKFLCSYTINGLYIIDPIKETLLLWTNEFRNAIALEVIDNKIYLMTRETGFHCLIFSPLDSLILQFYNDREYDNCMSLCKAFGSQLEATIPNESLNSLLNIEIVENETILMKLDPLIVHLKTLQPTHPVKLDSGIVVVHTGNSTINHEDYNLSKDNEESINYNNVITFDKKQKSVKTQATISEAKLNITEKLEKELDIVYKTTNNIHSSTTTEELENLIIDITTMVDLIQSSFETLIKSEESALEIVEKMEIYYFNALMANSCIDLACLSQTNLILKELTRAFINTNARKNSYCNCNNLLPSVKLIKPKYFETGKNLINKFIEANKENCLYICNHIPYMWREYLLLNETDCLSNSHVLKQCLQTRDHIVLSIILPLLDVKRWQFVITYLSQMNEGRCLFCDMPIEIKQDTQGTIQWSNIALEVIERTNPETAMNFLFKVEGMIPNVSFDDNVYKSIIFTKILHHRGLKTSILCDGNSLKRDKHAMCSTEVQNQLMKKFEKDLDRPFEKDIFGTNVHHWGMRFRFKSVLCSCCTLSLYTPILLDKGIAIFPCGHAYHVNCMIEKQLTRCNLHKTK